MGSSAALRLAAGGTIALIVTAGCRTVQQNAEPASAVVASTMPEAAAAAPRAAGKGDPAPREATSSLDLRVEPWVDFYFLVRAQAGGVVAREAELAPVVEAWLPVQDHVGTFGGFWRFDLPGLLARSPDEFAAWFADAPETVPSRAGGEIPIRQPGLAMAAAMREVWPRFRDTRWPERKAELQAALARLEERFLPRHQEALRHMLDSMGIADPAIEVPMFLVLDAHAPGASTYRSQDGPVAVLSTRDLLGEGRLSDLEETLLHETCHVLDLASAGENDAFSVLRRLLEERGIDRSDRRHHDVPHLVMFVQAERTMRQLFDPVHVAYGDTWRGEIAPLYERSGAAAEIVRRLWGEYLDGELAREEALRRIADEVVGLPP
jgi:hypothetical protein